MILKDERISFIANHYGKEKQEAKAMEEIAELSEELFYNILGGSISENTPSEIADVLIMLSQLIELYGIEKKVSKEIFFKLNRQIKRIESEV